MGSDPIYILHFHIYLKPPKVLAIDNGAQNLETYIDPPLIPLGLSMLQPSLLTTAVQTMLNQLGSASNSEEGIMFTVDVPSVPAQAVLVVQHAATNKGISPKPDTKGKPTNPPIEKDQSYCIDATNMFGESAFNDLVVLHGVLNRLGYSWKQISSGKVPKSVVASIKTTVVEPSEHGKVEYTEPAGMFWHYTPDTDYKGPDRVKFLAEAQGRRFTIIANILVHDVVDEFAKPRTCELFFNKPIKKADLTDGQPTYATGWSPSLRINGVRLH